MASSALHSLSPHLTFKGNLRRPRHDWLRLTPAYSVHLVSDLLARQASRADVVLDPFGGTGTTALVCAEQGIKCDMTDINPFLIWLARAKTRPCSETEVRQFESAAAAVAERITRDDLSPDWLPSLHQIEKWWDRETLSALGRATDAVRDRDAPEPVADLLKVTFCRVMIDRANVSFGHQSMSFKGNGNGDRLFPRSGSQAVLESWRQRASMTAEAAQLPILCPPGIHLCDARHLSATLPLDHYDLVITSPPYPNRMSYVRELRPYMYWLGFLENGRQAGELDWQAIGGTWGCATSNLTRWQPDPKTVVPFPGYEELLTRIAGRSPVLARYVQKYFEDMVQHSRELFCVVRPGGRINYIIGNSKFYDVLLPAEAILAAIFASIGFRDLQVKTIRKRTSKQELFEYVVSGRKP